MNRFFLVLILCIGIFFRIYNLGWGAPFYFHPDERNIASSVSQLNFPNQLNPHFFAYGSFPIYAIYFTGVFFNNLSSSNNSYLTLTKVNFENAIIISRLYSAFFSIVLLFLIYEICLLLNNKKLGFLTLSLSSLSVAFIQYSHFGTFEMWLTFFSCLLFYFLLLYYKTKNDFFLIIFSIILGLLSAIKISSIIIFVIPFFVIGLVELEKRKKKIFLLLTFAGKLLSVVFIAFTVFLATCPFVFIDPSSFLNSMNYEASVASGTLPVFYTGSFYNQIPLLFHYQYVLPFLLNPVLTVISIPSLFYALLFIKKRKNFNIFLILSFFCLLFFSQIFLFVKWTRYIVPSLPFLYLLISFFLIQVIKPLKKRVKIFLLYIFISLSLVFSFSFFITTYYEKDTRVSASEFAKKNIPPQSKILSEVYDMGIVPFNSNFLSITLFNFYDLDGVPGKDKELEKELEQNNFIILPSQRLVHSRFINSKKFPKSFAFYEKLFKGTLGFEKIYETPCNIYCKVAYLGNPVFSLEETATVFDRPTVFIFKRSEKRDDKLIFERK